MNHVSKSTATSWGDFRGVWTALATPFLPNLSIDWTAWDQLIQKQVQAGIHGIIPCGTTGESPTLSLDEKKKLISRAIEKTRGTSTRVIAGTGSNNTEETIAFSKWASEAGAAGVLVVTPYYNKPTQAGLKSHFTQVADAITCPIMLYNVPGRSGVGLTAETIAELAKHPRIRALKEATGNLQFQSEIIDQLLLGGSKLDILSGDDATYFPALCAGAQGAVSVASNICPEEMVALQAAVDQGNLSLGLSIHTRLFPVFRDLFVETNPAPVKAALAWQGLKSAAELRLPLVKMSEKSQQTLEKALIRAGVKSGIYS
jgi:4-hydroxy-tetrahydrodipicolinate synthase